MTKTVLSIIVHPDGKTERRVSPLSLDQLQAIVGGDGPPGYIEHVTASEVAGVYINEEGKLQNLEPNQPATEAFHAIGGRLFAGDYLAGVAIFVGDTDDEGEDISLPERDAVIIERVAAPWRNRSRIQF